MVECAALRFLDVHLVCGSDCPPTKETLVSNDYINAAHNILQNFFTFISSAASPLYVLQVCTITSKGLYITFDFQNHETKKWRKNIGYNSELISAFNQNTCSIMDFS